MVFGLLNRDPVEFLPNDLSTTAMEIIKDGEVAVELPLIDFRCPRNCFSL